MAALVTDVEQWGGPVVHRHAGSSLASGSVAHDGVYVVQLVATRALFERMTLGDVRPGVRPLDQHLDGHLPIVVGARGWSLRSIRR